METSRDDGMGAAVLSKTVKRLTNIPKEVHTMVEKKPFWLGAEPNWELFSQEWGGLPNPKYDEYVCCYCDLASKSTVAVTVGDGLDTMLGDSLVYEDGQGPDEHGWCGYQWDQDGQSWELLGPNHEYHWWEIDDLLWGALSDSLLNVVNEDHVMKTKAQIWDEIRQMSYVYPEAVAESVVEYWSLV